MTFLGTYFLIPQNIIIAGVFLVFVLLCIAAVQGFRHPERASVRTWILLAGTGSAEASLLLAIQDLPISLPQNVFALVAFAALTAALSGTDQKSETPDSACTKKSGILPAVVLALAAGLFIYLLLGLSTYSEIVLTWEGQVLRGFAAELNAGASPGRIFFPRLLWEDGLVSSGERSFIYGVFTHLVLFFTAFSTWSIRIVPLVAAFLCVPLIWQIGRRYFGASIAFTACLLYLANPAVLYYSRYGTSLSSTVLCLLPALWAALFLMSSRKPPWWTGVVTGLFFFLATLHYGPGRLCVILFAGFIFAHTAVLKREWTKEKIAALVMFAVTIALVFAHQYRFETADFFLNARGEQIFLLGKSPRWVHDQIGVEKSFPELDPDQKIRLFAKLIETTTSQFTEAAGPLNGLESQWSGISSVGDPPVLPLYFGPLLPFFLWGFVLETFKRRQVKWLIFAFWILSVTFVLLLTSRVDIHRTFVLVIPFIFLTAAGIDDFVAAVSPLLSSGFLKVPAGAAAFSLALAFPLVMLRGDSGSTLDSTTRSIASFGGENRRPVKIAVGSDHRNCSWLELQMVEKNRRTNTSFNESFESRVVDTIRDQEFQEAAAAGILDAVSKGPKDVLLILVPGPSFSKLRQMAENRGCAVNGREFGGKQGYLIEGCTLGNT